jgi:hypothetical protein
MSRLMQHLINMIQTGHGAAARGHVKNAISPLVWLISAFSAPLVALVWASGHFLDADYTKTLVAWTFALIGMTGAASLSAYFYFMFRDPDRLQSEEFQITRHAFRVIAQKGQPERIAESIEGIENPAINREHNS